MKEIIGVVIKDSIRKSNMTQEEFAKEMGMTLRNLANLFAKEHIPIEQLARISKILKKDFIAIYTEWIYEKMPELRPYENSFHNEKYSEEMKPDVLSISLNIKGSLQNVQNNLSELIGIIKEEAEQRGFKLA